MAMVRFATVCDQPGCNARSIEYTSFPSCRGCYEHRCEAHAVPGSEKEIRDGYPTILCRGCHADGEE